MRVNTAVTVYGDADDVVPVAFELLRGVDDGVMFDIGDDDVSRFVERGGDALIAMLSASVPTSV